MFQKITGIVLREAEYKDNDRILTILSREAGLLTAKARGVKRKSSPLKAGCRLLSYSEFTLFEHRGMRTIDEASPIEMFAALRDDLELLSLASYFAQLAEALAQQDAPDAELVTLLLYALHALCSGKPQALVKAAFEFRVAARAGYEPDLSGCAVCGREDPDRFNITQGMLQCAGCCGGSDGLHLPISPGTLAAMRYLLRCADNAVFSFTLGEASRAELSGLAETYLLTRLERGFYTLTFYKSLMLT